MSEKDDKTAPVPSGRLARLGKIGGLATRVAGGMLAEGARKIARGERPRLSDMLLTPSNARRVADQLARMRGAAMKVGQLLSMDAGDLLPPELADILARLRSDAKYMPQAQLLTVLRKHWGPDWQAQFAHFSMTPMAAASIGQVHRARLLDGTDLAIKIQYPGIRESIDSDVDNVAGLFAMSGLLPKTLNIKPLLAECKRQLHEEADYRREADCLERFTHLLDGHPDYASPQVIRELSREAILVMTCVGGEPVESFVDADEETRNRIAQLIFNLLFKEVFEFHFVQTDPNFANYRYDTQTRQLVLLDFGASRPYEADRVNLLRELLAATMAGSAIDVHDLAMKVGFYDDAVALKHQSTIQKMIMKACEPARWSAPYPFGQTDLAITIRDWGLDLGMQGDFWHIPPVDSIFLQRKLAGLYLLCARLKGSADLRGLASNATGQR
jgi:predicted unusual protein kinase regulating ubiquinone biosynthesis (AarF/ABC1/UbiB family)